MEGYFVDTWQFDGRSLLYSGTTSRSWLIVMDMTIGPQVSHDGRARAGPFAVRIKFFNHFVAKSFHKARLTLEVYAFSHTFSQETFQASHKFISRGIESPSSQVWKLRATR